MICYSIVEPDTLENVPEKWVPEVRHFCPGVQFILVGCKEDARTVQSFLDDLKTKGQKPVPRTDAQATADKIGAFDYLECSAKESTGVQEVFQTATRAAMSKSKGKKKGCMLL